MIMYYFRRHNTRNKLFLSKIILQFIIITCISTFSLLGFEKNDNNENTLKFVAVLFRHGDRSPNDPYPNDPHKNYNWPGGLASLSPKGTLQLYNLGIMLREKYKSLLPDDGVYDKNDIFVLSSRAERCLMSAQAFLAGFLPPNENFNTLPISWQPIAVNSIPRDRDNMLAVKMACDKYDKILENMKSDPHEELEIFLREHSNTIEYVSKHSGRNLSVFDKGENIYSVLSIEDAAGLPLPEWTKDVYPAKLLTFLKYNLGIFTTFPYMKQIRGGPFVTQIVDTMQGKIDGNISRKIHIYSGHDTTLVNVMKSLEIINQTDDFPNYGATLTFELHQRNDSNEREIQIWYHSNTTDDNPKKINIHNCSEPCLFEQFKSSVEHILVRNFNESCKLD